MGQQRRDGRGEDGQERGRTGGGVREQGWKGQERRGKETGEGGRREGVLGLEPATSGGLVRIDESRVTKGVPDTGLDTSPVGDTAVPLT